MTVAQIFGLAYGPCAITYPGNLTDDDQPNQNLVKNMVTSRRPHCFEAQPLVMLQNRYINFDDCIVGILQHITTHKTVGFNGKTRSTHGTGVPFQILPARHGLHPGQLPASPCARPGGTACRGSHLAEKELL